MNSTTDTSEYLLLFRGNDWHRQRSPEDIQKTMTDWMAWFDGLVAAGQCRGGQSLAPEGKVVAGKARSVSDGPYAEAKESVAGYFILTVPGEAEAARIAAVARIPGCDKLESYHLLYAVLGEFHFRAGDLTAATREFQKARSLADTTSERAFLEKRLRDCTATPGQ